MAEVDVPAPGGAFAGATTDRGRTPGGRFNGDGISGFVAQVLDSSILWIGVNPPSSDQYILWINTEDARWYGKWSDGDSTQWVDLSLPFGEGLPGPRGPQGERGLTGVTGVGIPAGGTTDQILVKVDGTDYNTYWGDRPDDGLNVLHGTGAPDDVADGVDGEFYIDTSAWYIYGPKASGTWPAGVSLIGPTGATGTTGAAGADGADGVDGVDGAGVAAGGTAGQVLAKIDGTDYNTEWVDQDGQYVPSGGTTGQALTKVDGTDYNVSWTDVVASFDLVDDTTPQLGGSLDVNGNSIVSVSNGNIPITPDGTGKVILDGLSWPTSDGTADYVLKTDGAGNLSWTENTGSSNAMVMTQQTGTTYTLLDTDLNGNKVIKFNNASAITLTVNSGMSGTEPVTFIQEGNGTLTVAAGASVTINSRGSLLSAAGKYSVIVLIPDDDAADTYFLTGDLA